MKSGIVWVATIILLAGVMTSSATRSFEGRFFLQLPPGGLHYDEQGDVNVGVGGLMAGDVMTAGIRGEFGISRDLTVFADLNRYEPDGPDGGFSFQGGAGWRLYTNDKIVPGVKLYGGVVGGLAVPQIDGLDVLQVDAQAVAGGTADNWISCPVCFEVFAGISYLKWEAEIGNYEDSESALSLGATADMHIGPNMKVGGGIYRKEDFALAARFTYSF